MVLINVLKIIANNIEHYLFLSYNKLKMINWILILGTLVAVLESTRFFTSSKFEDNKEQVQLVGAPKFIGGNTPDYRTFSLSTEASPSSNLAMTLSGYSMTHSNIISFDSYWKMNGISL